MPITIELKSGLNDGNIIKSNINFNDKERAQAYVNIVGSLVVVKDGDEEIKSKEVPDEVNSYNELCRLLVELKRRVGDDAKNNTQVQPGLEPDGRGDQSKIENITTKVLCEWISALVRTEQALASLAGDTRESFVLGLHDIERITYGKAPDENNEALDKIINMEDNISLNQVIEKIIKERKEFRPTKINGITIAGDVSPPGWGAVAPQQPAQAGEAAAARVAQQLELKTNIFTQEALNEFKDGSWDPWKLPTSVDIAANNPVKTKLQQLKEKIQIELGGPNANVDSVIEKELDQLLQDAINNNYLAQDSDSKALSLLYTDLASKLNDQGKTTLFGRKALALQRMFTELPSVAGDNEQNKRKEQLLKIQNYFETTPASQQPEPEKPFDDYALIKLKAADWGKPFDKKQGKQGDEQKIIDYNNQIQLANNNFNTTQEQIRNSEDVVGASETKIDDLLDKICNDKGNQDQNCALLQLLCNGLAEQMSETGKNTSFGKKITKLKEVFSGFDTDVNKVYSEVVPQLKQAMNDHPALGAQPPQQVNPPLQLQQQQVEGQLLRQDGPAQVQPQIQLAPVGQPVQNNQPAQTLEQNNQQNAPQQNVAQTPVVAVQPVAAQAKSTTADLANINKDGPVYDGDVISIDQACCVFLNISKENPEYTACKDDAAKQAWLAERVTLDSEIAKKDPKYTACKGDAAKQTWLAERAKLDSTTATEDPEYRSKSSKEAKQQLLVERANQDSAIAGMTDEERRGWLGEKIKQCKTDIDAAATDAGKKDPEVVKKAENAKTRINLLNRNFMTELDLGDKNFVERYKPATDTAAMDDIKEKQRASGKVGTLGAPGTLKSFFVGEEEKNIAIAKANLNEAIRMGRLKKINLENLLENSKAELYGGYNKDTNKVEYAFKYHTPAELKDCFAGAARDMDALKGISRCLNFSSSVDREAKSKLGLKYGIPCSYEGTKDPFYDVLTTCNKYCCPNTPPRPKFDDQKTEDETTEKENQEMIDQYLKIEAGLCQKRLDMSKHGFANLNQEKFRDALYGNTSEAPGLKEAGARMLDQSQKDCVKLFAKKASGVVLSDNDKKFLKNSEAYLKSISSNWSEVKASLEEEAEKQNTQEKAQATILAAGVGPGG